MPDELAEQMPEIKEILEKILEAYKTRKEEPEKYQEANKCAVEFCIEVTEKALETLKLANRISNVGNKMLSSDFKICAYYGMASVEASIVNVKINLDSIEDEQYKFETKLKYLKMHTDAELIKFEILKGYVV